MTADQKSIFQGKILDNAITAYYYGRVAEIF